MKSALVVSSGIAHYDVTALIGVGGMGQVYQTRAPRPERPVAAGVLTILSVALLATSSGAIELEFAKNEDGYSFSEDSREVIRRIANEAEAEVRRILPGLDSKLVLVVTSGSFVIEETGETGAALSPGRIRWTLDPTRPEGPIAIAEVHLRETLFHELHHLVRGWLISGVRPPRLSWMVS